MGRYGSPCWIRLRQRPRAVDEALALEALGCDDGSDNAQQPEPSVDVDRLRAMVDEWEEDAREEAREQGPGWVGAESAKRACAQQLRELIEALLPRQEGSR